MLQKQKYDLWLSLLEKMDFNDEIRMNHEDLINSL